MVQDDVPVPAAPDAVFTVSVKYLVAEAETDKPDDDIVGLDYRRVVLYADSVSGSSLSGDGQIPLLYPQLGFEFDYTGHIEYHCSRAGRLYSGTE